MLEITRLTVEHLAQGCVTDCPAPRIGFAAALYDLRCPADGHR